MNSNPRFTTGWLEITQTMIDQFAALTGDPQAIHSDPAAAAAAGFEAPIAHGFLTLALLTRFYNEAVPAPDLPGAQINYGFDKVRFLSPVPAGSRVRAQFELVDQSQTPTHLARRFKVSIEIDGADKPALIADWLTRVYPEK